MTNLAPETQRANADPERAAPPLTFAVTAHDRALRFASVALRALAAVNVLYLGAVLVGDFFNGTDSAPPDVMAKGLALFTLLPIALALLVDWSVSGTLTVGAEALTLALRRERIDIPVASVTCVRPLVLPWPMPGLVLELKSGRRFERILGTRESLPLFTALAAHLAHDSSAMLDFADALPRRRRWLMPVLKLGVLPLAMSLVIFRLHQMVVYGGPFGQYHAFGLGPYLTSFFVRWLGIAGTFFVLYGVLELLTEAVIYGLTWLRPLRARGIRRAAEVVSSILYFGGIPGYVAFRLLLD